LDTMQQQLLDMEVGPGTPVSTHPCATFSTYSESADMSTFPPTSDTSGISYEWNVYDETLPSFTKSYPPGTQMCFGIVAQMYNPLIAAGIMDNIQATTAEIAAGTTGLTKYQAWYATVVALPTGTEKTVKTLIYDLIVMLLYLFQIEAAASSGRANIGTMYASKLLYEGMTGFSYSTLHTEWQSKMNVLYSTDGYATWDVVKNSTMPPFYPYTKYTAHISNIFTMLPYNGVVPAAVAALDNLELPFTDPTGYFKELPLHSDFSVEQSGSEYIPTHFSGSMPAISMYRAMLRDYMFTDQVRKTVATPYACTYAGRRVIASTSKILGYVGGTCPSELGLFGLMREFKESVLTAQKAFAWVDVGLSGTPVFAASILDGTGYSAMSWYYRSIMTTVVPQLVSQCKIQYDVAWVGFFVGPKISLDTMQQQLLDMKVGP